MSYYPHVLRLAPVSAPVEATQDNQGNWVKPEQDDQDPIEIPCRIEYQSPGSFIASADGENLYFDFIVYMPLGYPAIPFGHTVTAVTQDEEIKNTAKRYRRGMFNARLWV